MQSVSDALSVAKEVLSRIQKNFVLFLSIVVGVVALAIGASLAIGPRYTSQMTVAAVSNSSTMISGLAGAASMFSSGSLSSLASSVLNPTSALDNYQDLLQSNYLAERLMQKDHIEQRLFPGAIDIKTGQWNQSFTRTLKGALYGIFGLSPSDRPTVEDVQRTINAAVVVSTSSQDQNTITVSCTWNEQTLCPALLMDMHRETEARLNSIMLTQAKKTSDYITENLEKVQVSEVRQAMIEILASAQKTMATTALDQPIAGIVLDPPIEPQRPSFPRPPLVLAIAGLFGLILGAVAAWLRGA